MTIISESQDLAAKEAAKTAEIQAQTDEFQAAAARSLSEARQARAKVQRTNEQRTEARQRRAQINAVLEQIMRDVSQRPLEYIRRKRDGEIKKAKFRPVTVEEKKGKIVKTYRGTYKDDASDRGYTNKLYDTRVEIYDEEGNLIKRQEYKTYDRNDDGEERVYLRREKKYENGQLTFLKEQRKNEDGWEFRNTTNYKTGKVERKDYRERKDLEQTGKPIYEVTTPEGKVYRSSNAEWVKERFGVDPLKKSDGSFTLQEVGTGKTYKARIEDIGGNKLVLGVRTVSKAEQEARVNVLAAPQKTTTSKTSTRETLPVLAMNQAIIENVIKGKKPPKPPPEARFELGGKFSVEPFDRSAPLATFKINERTGKPSGTLTAAPEREQAPRLLRAFGLEQRSEEYSLDATRFRDVKYQRSGAAEFKAAARGVYEFGEPILDPLFRGVSENTKKLLDVPGGAGELLATPGVMVANPKETLSEFKRGFQTNPSGTLTNLAAGLALGKIAGKRIAKYREARAAKTARTQLAKGISEGESLIYDERGFSTKKTGTQEVKVGKRVFKVETAAEETAGALGKESLLPERGRSALSLAEAAAGERAGSLAGEGRLSYNVVEGNKIVARGRAATGLGTADLGGAEVYARTAKGELILTKGSTTKTFPTNALEVGTLREGFAVRAGNKGRSFSRGKSAILTDKGAASKEVAISSQDLYYEDLTRIQRVEDVSRRVKSTPRALEGPPNYLEETREITLSGGDVRKVQQSTFKTVDATNRKLARPLEVNPLEQTPDFAFRQLFGEETPTKKRGFIDRLLADRGKQKGAQDLTESPRMSKLDAFERKLFTSAKRKTQPLAEPEGPLKTIQKKESSTPSMKTAQTGKALTDELSAQAIGKVIKEETPKNLATIQQKKTSTLKEGKLTATTTDLMPKQLGKASTKQESKPVAKSLSASKLEALQTPTVNILESAKSRGDTRIREALKQEGTQKLDNALKIDDATKLAGKQRFAERITDKVAQRTQTSTGIARGGQPPPPPPPPPPFIEVPKIPLPSLMPEKSGGLKGFIALVRRKGRFEVVTPEPLTKESALLAGLTKADKTAGVTVKLEEAGMSAKQSKPGEGLRLKKLLGKFKKGKGDTYIEKNVGRIDTLGEKEEITLKGIAASAQKGFGSKLLKGLKKIGRNR